ncbi:MAG: glycosyltransferase family 4 protein [Alphaproteobacteria bacterium]|nr:glycosyltransferase family 4 protein [Alphaproteobacteria bacterium]
MATNSASSSFEGTGTRIAVVLKGYPRLSETFIAQEILSLERGGVDITIVSLRHPTDGKTHPVHARISAPVVYLPEYLYQEPARVLRAWWRARTLSGYRDAFRTWLRDLKRDPTPNRIRRWGQALVLAAELDSGISALYAHFLHTPGSVTRYAANMSGRPWSVSAHAKDIWLTPDWEKREKLENCAWAVTCTEYGRTHLESLVPGKTSLSYHGLDLSVLPSPPAKRDPRHGQDPANTIRLVSVGRAVPKKGFDTLLHALTTLPPELYWHWTHIGGGSELKVLRRLAETLGITERIEWKGARAQSDVFDAYQDADLFILPSRIASDGDRDGLPNVLMEAASQGLCCLASDVAAVSELLRHGETGWLVPAEDPTALVEAIVFLAANSEQRLDIGRAGLARVTGSFDHAAGLSVIRQRLGLLGPPGHPIHQTLDAAQ